MHIMLKTKLIDRTGESIAESLVSILIVAVAAIMFAGMVTASSRIIDTSSKWMQEYYKAVSEINEKAPAREGGFATVKVGSTEKTEFVKLYSYEAAGVEIISYVPTETPVPSTEPSGG